MTEMFDEVHGVEKGKMLRKKQLKWGEVDLWF